MPTVDEVRKRFAHDPSKRPEPPAPVVDASAVRKRRKSRVRDAVRGGTGSPDGAGPRVTKRHYKMLDGGGGDLDAELRFGKHTGMTISELAATTAGREYLAWMLKKEGFPEELIEVVEAHLT